MWGSDPLLIREKPGVLSSVLIVGCHAVAGFYDKIVSQFLLPGSMWVFFSFAQCVGVA